MVLSSLSNIMQRPWPTPKQLISMLATIVKSRGSMPVRRKKSSLTMESKESLGPTATLSSTSTTQILNKLTQMVKQCTISQRLRPPKQLSQTSCKSSSSLTIKLRSISTTRLRRLCKSFSLFKTLKLTYFIIYRFPDGTTKFIYEDGEEKSIFPDGTVQKIEKNGVKAIEFANGQKDILYPDGVRVREFPDGKVRKTYPDGRNEVFNR